MKIRVTFEAEVTCFKPRMRSQEFAEMLHDEFIKSVMASLHIGTRKASRLDAPSEEVNVDWGGSIEGNTLINRIDIESPVEATYEKGES